MESWIQYLNKIINKYYWWQWMLFLVGALTILSLLGAIFLAAGSEPPGQYIVGEKPEVSDPMFITSLGNGLHSPIGEGGTVEILVNGEAFKSSLLQSIDEAQFSINFSVYIWEDGQFSREIIEHLLARQRQGVQVRILLDSFGSNKLNKKVFDDLKDAGAKVEEFREIEFGKLTRYAHRNHRRAIIMDGKIGYTGGSAVKDEWLGNAEDSDHWRDNMYKLTGPLAQSLQGDFVDLWSGVTGEFLTGNKFYSMTIPPSSSSTLKYIHITQTPSPDVQIWPDFLTVSIAAAKHSLYIETPYFVPNRQLLETILDRARSGVAVKLLVPDNNNDSAINRLASQYYYQRLLDAGVKIYEYNTTFSHTKFITVDSQWSIIGSPNLNTRSRRLDEENAFGILDQTLARAHEEMFAQDVKHSTEIVSETWKNRSVFRRPLEWISKIFDKQI